MSQSTATFLAWHIASTDLGLVSTKQVSAASQVLVLMHLAAHADANCTAYPPQERLAKYCYLSRSTVQYALKALEGSGHIKRLGTKKGHGVVARYLILPDQVEQIRSNADAGLAVAKNPKDAGQDAGLVAGLVAGLAPHKDKDKDKETPTRKTATKSDSGGSLEKEKDQEQTAVIERCLDLDLSTHPPQFPPGKALKEKIRSDYWAIVPRLPSHLTPGQVVTAAVAQRYGEAPNIVLMTPPAVPCDDWVEPDAAAKERIHQMLAAQVKTYTKRV